MSRPSAIQSVFWLTVSEILFNLSGYIIHAVAGRALGPADYGRYGLVVTLTTIIVVLIGNGIPTAMARTLSEIFEKQPGSVLFIKRKSAALQALLMGAVTVVFFLLSPIIAHALNDPTLTPLFRLSSLIIPAFAAASFYFSYFTGLHLFHHQSILKSFRSATRIVVIVGLLLSFGLQGALIGYILAPLFTFFLGLFLDARASKKYSYDAPPLDTDANIRNFSTKKLFRAALPITLFMLFYEIFISADLYLIKTLLKNDILTGFYNAALTIGRIPYYLFSALAIFLLPALAKIKSENNAKKLGKTMTQSLRYAGIILLPITLLIANYAEATIAFFFGSSYADSAPTLSILVFGMSFMTAFYLLCSALIGIGQTDLSMRLAVIGTALSIALNIVFIQSFGILGAAWATTIAAFITVLFALVLTQKHIPIRFSAKKIAQTALSGCVLAAMARLLPTQSILFLPYSLALGFAYLATLAFSGVITKNDWNPKAQKKSLE